MIRLNDKDNARINEKNIDYYTESDVYNSFAIEISIGKELYDFCYETKEMRDKDIELLDKLFDVKSIEDKAMCVAKPELYSNEGGIKKECEPVKEEKYITWEEVQNSKKKIKVKLPNGENRFIFCNDGDIVIARNDYREGRIYDEDLFNALKLKKVE